MLFEDLLKIAMGMFRIGGLLVAMPVFGISPMPAQAKFFLAAMISVALFRFQHALPPELWSKNGLLLLVVGREVGIGLLMGFGVRFIFLLVTTAMEFMGLQMGFAIANVFDPQNSDQISVLAQLGVVLAILFFFAIDLHHDVFRALVRSYELLPAGLPTWELGTMKKHLVSFVGSTFEAALRLSFPVMIAMLVFQVVMGVVSRTAPQMNLFFNIAFIVNIATGFVLLLIGFPHVLTEMKNFASKLFSVGYGVF